MSDFFTSPREAASENLYKAALSGRPIGEEFFTRQADIGKQQLRQGASDRIAGTGGDILSRLASMGVTPGSSSEALISKGTAPIIAGEQSAEAGIDANLQGVLANLLLNELNTGLSGLSSSSTFGNILAGLQTAGNIGAGVGNLLTGIKYAPPQYNFGTKAGVPDHG